jgi:hypothetical protein
MGGSGYSGLGSSGLAGNLPNLVGPAATNLLSQIMNNLAITPRLATASTGPTVTPTETFNNFLLTF